MSKEKRLCVFASQYLVMAFGYGLRFFSRLPPFLFLHFWQFFLFIWGSGSVRGSVVPGFKFALEHVKGPL